MTTPTDSPSVADWQEGQTVEAYAFVANKEERTDRNGRTYLHLQLADATGSIAGFVWPDSPAIGADFEAHAFVSVSGSVRKYRDDLQMTVRTIRLVNDMDRAAGFDEARLVPSTREDIGELWDRLETLLTSEIERPSLQRLADYSLERWGESLRTHPAAKSIHHAYLGGLLEHVVSMAELAVHVCGHYTDLDRDLILVGVLFHDLGKLSELGAMPANDYTPEGRLVGHVVLGRDLLREACRAVGDVPPQIQLELEHLVLSHQGRREWGAPVEPMTAEAMALHFIDDLDSKLSQLRRAREDGRGFRFLRPLGRFIWLGEETSSDSDGE